MAQTRTPQQIADAARKRAATVAANRAAGVPTVRQQRAAAKAAKLGQPYTPPAPSYSGRARRRRSSYNYSAPTPSTPRGPLFATPTVPKYRDLKIVALASLEALFVARLTEKLVPVNSELESAYAQYKSIKARALAKSTTSQLQNEADTALNVAIIRLLKLAL